MNNTVELLAPAGNMAALHAAVRAGADAVYLGLESFNARAGADNFTQETLAQACNYAHLRGVKIYVTFNTIILPSEVKEALETIRQAYRAGADAFIVQDIGIAAEIRRTLPQAELHISTQMNIHNAAGIEAAARLGASRVTLSREVSLAEIEHLSQVAAHWGLEIETFAHGAICVCYSGQCFMSSLIGGRSANRGACAQACRLPYELHNAAVKKPLPSPGEHLLSPQDLCSIDLLPELVCAGTSSLKLEGRMKSPEYVFGVTSVYRAVLDRVLAWKESGAQGMPPRATQEEKSLLESVFSRGFTTAYLENNRSNTMMSYGRPNNRGVFVGRVASMQGRVAALAVECDLVAGDIVEFWTNKGHFTCPVDEVKLNGKGHVLLEPSKPVGKGDRVFRVRSAEAVFEDNAFEPRVSVRGHAVLKKGEPLVIRFMRMDDALESESARAGSAKDEGWGSASGDVIEPARTKAVSAEEVREHIDRLGQTPYYLEELTLDLDEGVGVGFSQLHRVRAAALESLTEKLLEGKQNRLLEKVAPRPIYAKTRNKGLQIAAFATNPACARAAKRAGADIIYVPALNYKRGESIIAGQRNNVAEQAGYPKQAVIALPTINHDFVEGTREDFTQLDVWNYVKAGKPVLVENLGELVRAHGEGSLVDIGPHLPLTNQLALETAVDLGAQRAWLSPELTLKQIEAIAKESPIELGLTVIGTQELMVTEHCILMSQGPCDQHCDVCNRRKSPHYLKDRKGFEFPVITDAMGRSHLYNSVELDVAHTVPELISAGLSLMMVDTTLMNVEQTTKAVSRLHRARSIAQSGGNAVSKAAGATSGHLFRGIS